MLNADAVPTNVKLSNKQHKHQAHIRRHSSSPAHTHTVNRDLSASDSQEEESNSSSATEPMEAACIMSSQLAPRGSDFSNENVLPLNTEDASTQTTLTLADMSFYDSIGERTSKLKRTVNAERMKSYRLRKKVKNLIDAIDDLKERSLISNDLASQLLEVGGREILTIVENKLKKII